MPKETEKLAEGLSPLERKIIPFLNLSPREIREKTKLDSTSLLRALKFLENKGALKIVVEKNRFVELGSNGAYYKKNRLPERRLLDVLGEKRTLGFDEAKSSSKLSDNEFKVSLGILKNRGLIEIKNGRIEMKSERSELTKQMFEEKFLEKLPLKEDELNDEEKSVFEKLKKRKDIVEVREKKIFTFILTELGKKVAGREFRNDFLEEVTPEIIKKWKKGKVFRKYDIYSDVPKISGGRKHFVSEAVEEGKRIWIELGFKEMSGKKVQTSFWNFDVLFTAQDHPVRELHDTFFIKDFKGKISDKKLLSKVKQAHESGVEGSKGWNYKWKEEEAKKVVLRTHTTCLSAKKLFELKKEELPAKFFAIGRNFRNETVDWSHGFEFNQTEGIVVDENANLRNLIGYLKNFAEKLGFKKIRIQPAYFPYTEPSLEGAVWNEEKKEWVEVLAAGIFRPEVTAPLLGEPIPVLAWGPGFDRLMMMANKINDMRKIYENDLKYLRNRRAG
ncbi:phenylalanine--tRNA ligase subunit alpha [Candidatus Pacearchaeota archaeon]|nr:phenylalanine--tRNA ligase subunit alpha [Candidatus Pacearchaeota archaeon]